jgi:flagellar biosynthesis protein FliQ
MMGPDTVMELGRQALTVVSLVCAPLLLAGMIVGLIISIFQAATQVSESTLSFLPKVAAVIVVLIIGGGWILEQLTSFTTQIIQRIGEVGP